MAVEPEETVVKSRPVALTIAGSDSGGGAGIQADLKSFLSTGSFGTSAITCLTAQNPEGVSGILEIDPDFLEKQIRAVFSYFSVGAVKTGMLLSKEIVSRVALLLREFRKEGRAFRFVLDPVMVATSGAGLLREDAVDSLISELLPLADLVTPNLDEGRILGIGNIQNSTEIGPAAEALSDKLKTNVLLKGGHLQNAELAVDALAISGRPAIIYSKPFIRNFYPHGTGCTYSSAIASYLAQGNSLEASVSKGKDFLHSTIVEAYSIGRSKTLNHFPKEYR
ncbi:bifunctional hydroxymethylpyrimidine kinase/phosphomethylpyrimidine kinase [Leptospira fluminis]|uniref:hydroxymethylpyrimidine kinase n=1 Tax=Leptospira fluminis TaxID=2484979 RepID=A0A4R9GS93_9LEPT|nr:bifunctional hydroxymethylpyrimidine kinase/phosphomethylpyrimidine kinase [Leptospira fluminis]TGK21086.1 bifunctional hydroxymethylpyrimidine kinase/phosphomethylpyrimidine kinase [Leptospira fluminis]